MVKLISPFNEFLQSEKKRKLYLTEKIFFMTTVADKKIIVTFIPSFKLKEPSRGVLLKRCSENMQQIYRRTPMSKCGLNKVTLKSHFNMGVLLYISCIFLEHLFLRTPLDDCFCSFCVNIFSLVCSVFKIY